MEKWNDEGTEIYAQELAKEICIWHQTYDVLLQKKLQLIDLLLREPSEQSRKMLCDTLKESQLTRELCRDTQFGYMVIINQVYLDEKKNGEQYTIYDKGNSIKDLIKVLNQMKFLLWELEFLKDSDTPELFKRYVCENRVSGTMLKNMILIASVDVNYMVNVVADILNN
ncbi:MAG: hypothetical protein ACI4GW_10110 [Lachnospiraceae bacterium]